MEKTAHTTKQAFRFLDDRKILVADSSGTMRRSIGRVLSEYGVKPHNIINCHNYQTAMVELEREKPSVVITDYTLGSQAGLKLMEPFSQINEHEHDRLFIIETSNASESAVAEAVDEEIDSYILKPFTASGFSHYLEKAIKNKIDPGPYQRTLNQGKTVLRSGNLDEALQLFKEARVISPSPALACYYVGYAYEKKGDLKNAKVTYKEGLDHNKIHFKCLNGLFEVLLKLNELQEAYKIAHSIGSHFPINAKRLARFLHLAVKTGNFEDISRYYEIYTNLDQKEDNIIKTITAALSVAGKFHLQKRIPIRADEIFSMAVITSRRNPHVIAKFIFDFVEHGYPSPVRRYLEKFEPQDHESVSFKVSELICLFAERKYAAAIHCGRCMMAEGIHTPEMYQYLVKSNHELGRKKAADELVSLAESKWPEFQI